MYGYSFWDDGTRKIALKSFNEYEKYVLRYIGSFGSDSSRYAPGAYKCPRCWGSKQMVDPKEEPDVIEGHKFSNRVTCEDCSGKGYIDIKRLREIYTYEKKIQDEIDAKERHFKKLVASAKKKLTREEFNAIYNR